MCYFLVNLFLEHLIVCGKLFFEEFIMIEPGCKFLTFDFVFFFFVFETFYLFGELFELMGEESLFFCHNLKQVPVLLVLLGEHHEVLSFEGFFVFLRNGLVG